MKTVSKYWNLVRLDSSGKLKTTAINTIEQFLQQQFDRLVEDDNVTDKLLQRELIAIKNSQEEKNLLADRSLRCYISHQIKQTCILLHTQFGREHGFGCNELFVYTLTDTLDNFKQAIASQPADTKYKPLSVQILSTFDPNRSSLSTWTNRCVKQCRDLQLFLLEQGVYLISNWAILNDTRVKQVERILSEFHNLTPTEIKQAAILLYSYHQVYRRDRLKNLQSKGRKCTTPTKEQLDRIANLIEQQSNLVLSAEQTLTRLEELAERLREYRIYVRGGKAKRESLDNIPQMQTAANLKSDENSDCREFLKSYQQQFRASLDISIAETVGTRLSKFKGKKAAKKNQFLIALKLFYCRGESMSAIAPQINLQAQYQVTRLLKLKELRTDIRHHMLQKLRDWTAKHQALPPLEDLASLQQRDREIDLALGSQIDLVLDEEKKTVTTAKSTASILAQRICHYVDSAST